MMPDGPVTAVVTRVLPAPPEDVYAEWLDPVALADFIAPEPSTAGEVECDPRIGGRLRIVMLHRDHVVLITGEYLDLEPPRLLRFTWSSDLGDGFDSVVTVRLEPHGDGETLMTIEHAQLPAEWGPDHQSGWTSIAAQLAAHLAR
jgi:uncharacterized protein YndB with AHSA1/START domain